MAPYEIRFIGDPVLKQPAAEVTDIDDKLVRLADDMLATMYDAPGLGLAAPQVGVQKRMFVYDLHDDQGPRVVVNPRLEESRGEWTYEEGCLSVPGLSWEIVRPNEVHIVGLDLDGNDISIEASELEGRVFQHELDHLDGILLVERLEADVARDARRAVRELMLAREAVASPANRGLSLR